MRPLASIPAPQRILIIKPSAIGDVVHALPVLHGLRQRWPEATIDWMLTPVCAGLVQGHPELDEVILFRRRHFGKGWLNPRIALEFFQWTRSLRQRRYDLVVDLQGLFRSGWLSGRTRAPCRVGFARAREGAWLFYTHRISEPPGECHAVTRNLRLAEALGCDIDHPQFNLAITDTDRQAVDPLLPEDLGPFAVLLPGTNWATKRWPVRHFASLVQPLRERFGLRTVVAGGPDDVDLARQIPDAVNLAGKTTLIQLAALLERAAVVIANDSGPMHIAAALDRPLVALFGPTNPTRTGPFGREDAVLRLDIACSPCYSRHCSHQSCLQWLEAEAVLTAVERQLNASSGVRRSPTPAASQKGVAPPPPTPLERRPPTS